MKNNFPKITYLLHVLTAVFIGLKLGGAIEWSWWKVLLPSIIHIGTALALLLLILCVAIIKYIWEEINIDDFKG